MKNILKFALAVLAAVSCGQKPDNQVSIQWPDRAGEDLCLMFLTKNYSRCDHADTLTLDENGCAAFDNVDPSVFGNILITTFAEDGSATYNPYVLMGVVPGEYVTITGSLEEPVYDGSKYYKQLNEYASSTKDMEAKLNEVYEEYKAKIEAEPLKSEELSAELSEKAEAIYDDLEQAMMDFIKAHSNDNAAGYLTAGLYDLEKFEQAYAMLSDKVKKGVMAPFMENTRNLAEERAAREAARAHLEDGDDAPDFTLPTPDGGTFTLSSLEGKKYVMLDFWGSWCKW